MALLPRASFYVCQQAHTQKCHAWPACCQAHQCCSFLGYGLVTQILLLCVSTGTHTKVPCLACLLSSPPVLQFLGYGLVTQSLLLFVRQQAHTRKCHTWPACCQAHQCCSFLGYGLVTQSLLLCASTRTHTHTVAGCSAHRHTHIRAHKHTHTHKLTYTLPACLLATDAPVPAVPALPKYRL